MSGDTTSSPTSTRQVLTGLDGKSVCPFCGAVADDAAQTPCARCTMDNTPATRQATKARIGPWYVLQVRNPSAPGMKFATLLALIKKGQVTPRSIVRGPTTHQLWRFAAKVKGVSREFGLCYGCGDEIEPGTGVCPHCRRPQEPPVNPDLLLETREAPQSVRATIHRQIPTDSQTPPVGTPAPPEAPPAPAADTFSREPVARRGMTDEITEDLLKPRPPGRVTGEEILTPQELAAVFQLNVGKKAAAPEAQRDSGRQPRTGRYALLALIVLAVVGAGVYLYLVPQARAAATQWSLRTYAAARDFIQGNQTKPTDPVQPTAKPADPVPPPAPAARPQAPVAPEPAPAPKESEPAATPPAPIHADPDAAIAEARRLWREAITAEGRGDYAAAVRGYEQIRQLPPHAWPSGLDLRLDLARKQLKK